MPHHRPPSKHRSLHRQLSERTSLSTTVAVANAQLPIALEHSLDEWFSRSSSSSGSNSVSSGRSCDPDFYGTGNGNHLIQSPIATTTTRLPTESSTLPSPPPQPRPSASVPVITHIDQQTHSSPQSSCPCCQLTHCQSWKKMSKVIRKLETETRLAAEIGQSLLQKNEAYLMESNQLKEQLQQCEDRKQELEISLDDTERLAQKLKHEKDKWMWQYEKSEKILNESVIDLENSNLKCAALANDLEQTKLEMEKLELLKYKSHQANTREDTLQSKLEDTMQELMISRKTELALESKYKKLLAQYGSLSNIYQDLCKDSSIKKINNKQVKPLLSLATPTVADIQQASIGELVTFIKELLSTNDGLKSKLLNTSIQLDDTRNELNNLHDKHHITNTTRRNDERVAKQIDQSNGNKRHTTIATIPEKKSDSEKSAVHTNGLRRHHSESSCTAGPKHTRESIKSAPSQSCANKKTPPIPQSTTSTPVVHHHYHYYLRQRKQDDNTAGSYSAENNNDIVSAYCDDQNCTDSESSEETPIPLTSQHSDLFSLFIDTNLTSNDTNDTHPCETIAENGLPTPLNNTDQIQQPQRHSNNTDSESDKVTTDVINNDTIDHPILTLSPSSSAPIPTTVKTAAFEHHSTTQDQFAPTHSKGKANHIPTNSKCTPYSSLLDQAKSVLQRLRSTDTRILNRRLQRAFDIGELSNMSNVIIQNIVSDVDTLDTRFFWLAPGEHDSDGGRCNESMDKGDQMKNDSSYTFSSGTFLVNEFFPMVQLLQELLHEIGQLYITINHLQVAYVKKVKENEARVDKEVMGKHQVHSSANNRNNMVNKNSRNSIVTPPLIPSTSTSAPLSTIASTEHINVNPVHWLSTLFAHDIDNTRNLNKKTMTTHHRPTGISTSKDNKYNTSTTTTLTGTDNGDIRTQDRRQKGLQEHINKASHRKKQVRRRQQQQQQQYYNLTENQNHNQLWPTMSSIMDEWTQTTTIKHSFSSSLDREWLLDLY